MRTSHRVARTQSCARPVTAPVNGSTAHTPHKALLLFRLNIRHCCHVVTASCCALLGWAKGRVWTGRQRWVGAQCIDYPIVRRTI